jgi:hypothetical protein
MPGKLAVSARFEPRISAMVCGTGLNGDLGKYGYSSVEVHQCIWARRNDIQASLAGSGGQLW